MQYENYAEAIYYLENELKDLQECKLSLDQTKALPNLYINQILIKQNKKELDSAIQDYTKAIDCLENVFENIQAEKIPLDQLEILARAYLVRGLARESKRETNSAIEDYTKAIYCLESALENLGEDRISLSQLGILARAYVARGLARKLQGEINDAITDCNIASNLYRELQDFQ